MQASLRFCIGVILLALCLPQPLQALNNYEDMCRLFKNGIQIRKPATCNEYIECINGEGTMRTCADSLVFEASSQECVKATASNSVHCGNLCEGLDGKWVADPTNCQNYLYCRNGEALAGHCEGNQHFNEALQSCEHEDDSICVDVANICELLPDKTKFRQEDDCNEYYECKSGTHTLKTCSSTQYFDVESGSCKAKNLVECSSHSKKDVCLLKTKPLKGFQPDGATCRGYFYCGDYGTVHDIDPTWGQCPEGLFYDDINKTCAIPTSVVCTHNRCEGRGTMLVASSSNDCHNYIHCVDGVEVEEKTCHWDYFFNEKVQGCTKEIIYDVCCDGRD
ncbi:peritrophin-44 [Drosophila hydei]|uniref:Peritrophin-44 n=1 Tax=Drosophila hydei TaxID=7224 RepID=A0A6J2SXV2_DROHY|nr:peritrophin-44 [Drosophila hydei]